MTPSSEGMGGNGPGLGDAPGGAEDALQDGDVVGAVVPEKVPLGLGRRVGGEPANELDHFQRCSICGQHYDMRHIDQVFHHADYIHQPMGRN